MKVPDAGAPLELWGGIECTVNRVGHRYMDQTVRSGHEHRPDDLDRIASLGIRTLRYPVLWERVAPEGLRTASWTWTDERLGRLRDLGIRPIVGLVHHGSGPRDTSLLDPAFPRRLAAFARAVAERYPWVDAYTPVNEPLTTARFSALYGHWYPHRRDDLSFATALANECRAVALAMRAIREVRPDAVLVQTEDLGETRSTPRLAYQAEYENLRRWLTFDLLEGRVDRAHPLRDLFAHPGLEASVDALVDAPCPPDILGVNYYITSERFLDDRLELYPEGLHGGNGEDRYVDVEAVRGCSDPLVGIESLLRKTYERYRRPIVVTEAHMGAHREDQMRWLHAIWSGARAARRAGADVRAVAVWAVLGSFDWHNLVTRDEGHYEPGPFDVRPKVPRETGLAKLARELAHGREPTHPVLDGPGWWERPGRLFHLTTDHEPGPRD